MRTYDSSENERLKPHEIDSKTNNSSTEVILWDPLEILPRWRKWIWLGLSLIIIAGNARFIIGVIDPIDQEQGLVFDFIQEWVSGRNLMVGLPVYANLNDSLKYHSKGLGFYPGTLLLDYNAHPPASVVLLLPLSMLTYRSAHLIWNIVSLLLLILTLALIVYTLKIRINVTGKLTTLALLSCLHPLHLQFIHGLLHIILLLLITVAWLSDRENLYTLAGLAIDMAAAVKVFPGFLLLYFVMKGKWKAVLSGLITVAIITLITLPIIGTQTYIDYFTVVIPSTARYRTDFANVSLAGFWVKLFEGAIRLKYQPIPAAYPSVLLSKIATPISLTIVAILLYKTTMQAKSRTEKDLAYGLTLTSILMVSPIRWDHYFVLLILPVAIVWCNLPANTWARLLLISFLSLNTLSLMNFRDVDFSTVKPWYVVTRGSIGNYCLFLFYLLQLTIVYKRPPQLNLA